MCCEHIDDVAKERLSVVSKTQINLLQQFPKTYNSQSFSLYFTFDYLNLQTWSLFNREMIYTYKSVIHVVGTNCLPKYYNRTLYNLSSIN